MTNVYPKEYIEKNEVLEEKYTDKKERDSRARILRKDGYSVNVETIDWGWMDGSKVFYLAATRPRNEVFRDE